MSVQFERLAIPDVVLIRPKLFEDGRGFFFESWHKRRFAEAGIDAEFVQDNQSRSVANTLRGLHYQIEKTQGKLVQVVAGAVFDVAVDLRRSSPTFGRWVGAELSADNHHQLWVPPGFAHGFLVLTPTTDFSYKCTDYYAPEHERCIRWDDEDVGVRWPLPASVRPVLSKKDAAGVSLRAAETFP